MSAVNPGMLAIRTPASVAAALAFVWDIETEVIKKAQLAANNAPAIGAGGSSPCIARGVMLITKVSTCNSRLAWAKCMASENNFSSVTMRQTSPTFTPIHSVSAFLAPCIRTRSNSISTPII